MPQATTSTKPQSKVSLCFIVPLNSAADSTEVRATYKELHRQVTEFANAITRDPNVLVNHSVVSPDPKDLKEVPLQPVYSKVAATQAVRKPKPEKELPEPDTAKFDDEPPRIKAMTDWKPTTAAARPVQPPIQPTPATPVKVDTKATVDKIFEKLKRTTKSAAIVEYMASRNGNTMTVEEIAKGSGYDARAVNNWLGQTAPDIKNVKKTGRGIYTFEV